MSNDLDIDVITLTSSARPVTIDERLAYWSAEWAGNQSLREAAEMLGVDRNIYLLRLLRQDFEREPALYVATGTNR